MQCIDDDLSVGTLGLRVVRTLRQIRSATCYSLAVRLHAAPARLQSELSHLAALGIVVSTDEKQWAVSLEGSQRWREALEGRLFGVTHF